MAEKEKRRATTFVTSRGAIINVAAPSVYIAPGVTPVDVTSPAELREELDIHSALTWMKIQRAGVDAHFDARITTQTPFFPTNTDFMVVPPSSYWKYTGDWGVAGQFISPATYRHFAVYTKQLFEYPIGVFWAKLPALSVNNQFLYFGFENDSNTGNGTAAFQYIRVAGVNRLFIVAGGTFALGERSIDVSAALPVDAETAKHHYSIIVSKAQAEWYIDNVLVGVLVNSPNLGAFTEPTYPPYAMMRAPNAISPNMLGVIELQGLGTQVIADIHPYYLRVTSGERMPSRVYRLYQAGATTLMAGSVIAAGSLTSHPFPVFGYAGKSISFRASEQGTLSVEVLEQTDNWREYDTMGITKDKLKDYSIEGEEMLARVVYTPNTYPCTISEGEVTLR